MSLPDANAILDLMEAFRRSKVMFAAVSFGVFDRLERGPADAASLLPEADPGAAERLLDACVSLGLLTRKERRYANTPQASAYLCRESEHTLAGYILYSDRVLFPLWSHLEDAVREGSNRWRQTFGFEGDLFSHFFKTPEAQRDFLLGVHGLGKLSSPAVAAAFDLSRFGRLADVGGATGHLAAAVRRRYPRIEAVVFDLPAVVSFARTLQPDRSIEFLSGDFFRDALPAADLYVLGRILHDWGEAEARTLLEKIHAALPAGGGLLLAEKLLAEDHTGPISAQMQSINMLVCTDGRERSLEEYRRLLEGVGFVDVRGKRTGAPLDAVFARKS